MKIAFSPPYIDQSVIDEVLETLQSGWITTGPKCKALEEEVKKLTGCKAAIGVNSWTSGAQLVLTYFGVGPGDEVIIPAYTYSATALAVIQCGATPVMVDIKDDFTIDPAKVRAAITVKTKVIIPVDIAGWPCDYDALNDIVNDPKIVNRFNPTSEYQSRLGRILLMSDAAHSIGSIYNGESAALRADITVFSFHAVKNITTAEGGCVCLNLPMQFDHNAEYRYLKMYTLNGQNKSAYEKQGGGWKYDILFHGLKINMPDICAAIGLAQIRKYKNELLPARKTVAFKYHEGFKDQRWYVAPPLMTSARESSYHIFALRIDGINELLRDHIIADLVEKGISVNVHFIPMPMLTYFKELGFDISDYPNSYAAFAAEISLPIYPQMTEAEINYVIENVTEAVQLHRLSHEKVY